MKKKPKKVWKLGFTHALYRTPTHWPRLMTFSTPYLSEGTQWET